MNFLILSQILESRQPFIPSSHADATIGFEETEEVRAWDSVETRLIAFASSAAVGGTVAVVGFGVPLGTLLLIGVLLCCPIMMIGMHGGTTAKPDGTPTVSTEPNQGPLPRR